MIDLEQARSEVLAYARRLGDVLKRTRNHGGEGGDSSTFHNTNEARFNMDRACVAYSRALTKDEP